MDCVSAEIIPLHPSVDELAPEFGLALDIEVFVESQVEFEFGRPGFPQW